MSESCSISKPYYILAAVFRNKYIERGELYMIRNKKTIHLLLAMVLLLITAFPASVLAEENTEKITGIAWENSTSIKLNVSESKQLRVIAKYENQSNKFVELTSESVWSTSNAKVATIKNGKVTAKTFGEAVITAKYGDFQIEALITVDAKVKSLKSSNTSYRLNKGAESALPTVKAFFENGTEQDVTTLIKWTLSSPNAEISNGKIKGLAPGRATLSGVYLNKSITIPIAINDELVKIESSSKSLQLNIKKGKTLQVSGTYSNGKKVNLSSNIKWESSNSSIAKVTGSKVIALAEGSTTLTGSYQGQTVTVQVNVVPLLVKVTPSEKKLKLTPGGNGTVNLTATYDTGKTISVTDQVVWTSSKPAVATVTNGKIVAVSKGTASIKAKFGTKTVTISVSVK